MQMAFRASLDATNKLWSGHKSAKKDGRTDIGVIGRMTGDQKSSLELSAQVS